MQREVPLAPLTTFAVGGPAEYYARPESTRTLASLLSATAAAGITPFILGDGANIVVADRGIPGLTIDLRGLTGCRREGSDVVCAAGDRISAVSAWAAEHELGGLDFIFRMPGTVGGALWMNARCYDAEISAVFVSAQCLSLDGSPVNIAYREEDWGYKRSPFQGGELVITGSRLRLHQAERESLWDRMRAIESDRYAKGHFLGPCAGSVFKNDRRFGAPSGKLLDSLGARGWTEGGAQVSPKHANIILNAKGARASDIARLARRMQEQAERALGYRLEPEIRFVGDWDEADLPLIA